MRGVVLKWRDPHKQKCGSRKARVSCRELLGVSLVRCSGGDEAHLGSSSLECRVRGPALNL